MKKWALLVFVLAGSAFAEPVEDNSFLVEEAYNQEPGVVQFINVWQKQQKGNDWTYTFINEIPMGSQAHQFSYELPFTHLDANDKTQIEDIKLNYRYEFLRNETVVTTGRLSLTTPTGDYKKGFGSNAVGYEASMITSVKISNKWVQHWNLGAGITPDAKLANGDKADNSKFFWGMSQVYLYTDNLNFMLELAGSHEQVTTGPDTAAWEQSAVLSPSVRYAIDIGNWQFVPGLAIPFGIGPTAGQNQALVYLSIEGKMW